MRRRAKQDLVIREFGRERGLRITRYLDRSKKPVTGDIDALAVDPRSGAQVGIEHVSIEAWPSQRLAGSLADVLQDALVEVVGGVHLPPLRISLTIDSLATIPRLNRRRAGQLADQLLPLLRQALAAEEASPRRSSWEQYGPFQIRWTGGHEITVHDLHVQRSDPPSRAYVTSAASRDTPITPDAERLLTDHAEKVCTDPRGRLPILLVDLHDTISTLPLDQIAELRTLIEPVKRPYPSLEVWVRADRWERVVYAPPLPSRAALH